VLKRIQEAAQGINDGTRANDIAGGRPPIKLKVKNNEFEHSGFCNREDYFDSNPLYHLRVTD